MTALSEQKQQLQKNIKIDNDLGSKISYFI